MGLGLKPLLWTNEMNSGTHLYRQERKPSAWLKDRPVDGYLLPAVPGTGTPSFPFSEG